MAMSNPSIHAKNDFYLSRAQINANKVQQNHIDNPLPTPLLWQPLFDMVRPFSNTGQKREDAKAQLEEAYTIRYSTPKCC